jgi:hypothetical protein
MFGSLAPYAAVTSHSAAVIKPTPRTKKKPDAMKTATREVAPELNADNSQQYEEQLIARTELQIW